MPTTPTIDPTGSPVAGVIPEPMPTASGLPPAAVDRLLHEAEEHLRHELRVDERRERGRRRTLFSALAFLLLGAMALVGAMALLGDHGDGAGAGATPPAGAHADHGSATAAQSATAGAEAYRRPDPTLPAVPAGAVKRFRIQVYEHLTQVSDALPATRVWSYGVNGVAHRGTGVSTPMVVTQGDRVQIDLINRSGKGFKVAYSHSIDFHSSEVAPNKNYKTIGPGQTTRFRFTAKHVGVFMYHCATDPVLMHTGAGMVGMMVVKPRNLAPVDRELWLVQQEYYLGPRAGDSANLGKMQAENPDVVAFNGYANQYEKQPIAVRRGERVRMYVLNAGPSIWSAFHVIGTVFDRTVIEGQVGRDAQTVNLAPSQGGWVEFNLDQPGNYPFVNHSFAGMGKGAAGVLTTGDGGGEA